MKLSTIIRAIARPYVDIETAGSDVKLFFYRPDIRVRSKEDRFTAEVNGYGFTVECVTPRPMYCPSRARSICIGDLAVAWWGRAELARREERGAA